jgi:hypothetical protein
METIIESTRHGGKFTRADFPKYQPNYRNIIAVGESTEYSRSFFSNPVR